MVRRITTIAAEMVTLPRVERIYPLLQIRSGPTLWFQSTHRTTAVDQGIVLGLGMHLDTNWPLGLAPCASCTIRRKGKKNPEWRRFLRTLEGLHDVGARPSIYSPRAAAWKREPGAMLSSARVGELPCFRGARTGLLARSSSTKNDARVAKCH